MNLIKVMLKSYLNQGAVAVPRRLFIKVIVMIDGGEAGDHGLQGSAVVLNLSHTCDQALCNNAVRQIRILTPSRKAVFTYCLHGCKHNPVIHI